MKTFLSTLFLLVSLLLFAHEDVPCQDHDHAHDHEAPTPCQGHNHDHGHESALAAHTPEADAADAAHAHNHDHQHNHKASTPCQGHDHDHEHATPIATLPALEVSPSVQALMGITTQKVEQKVLSATLPLHGRFAPNPDAQALLVAPIAGRLKVLVETYATVEQGQPIATLTSPELLTRWNEITLLQKRLETYKTANVANIELSTQLALKEAEWAALVGDFPYANGTLTLTAPITGRIEARLLANGAWCETGSDILLLRDTTNLCFKALLPSDEAKRLTDNLPVRYGEALGKLTIDPPTDNGLLPLTVTFPTPLKTATAGAYAMMECLLPSDETPTFVIPKKALVMLGTQPTVFLRDSADPTRFIAVAITPDATHGPWIALHDNTLEGQEVVTTGQYELKLALPSAKEKAIGHFHADGTFHTAEH